MVRDLLAEHRQSSKRWHKTFESFMQCMGWAEEGKTFIYYHPKFVAIDMKTWNKLNKRKNLPTINYYDEYQDWTPEMDKQLSKILKNRLKP